MKRAFVYAVAAAFVVAAPIAGYAAQKSDNGGKVPASDQKFIIKAAQDNKAEIELGKLAAERGSSDSVKQFGQRMATDHGKAYEELQKLAQDKGVVLPPALDAKHKRQYDRLSKLSGADFDRAYMKDMERDHNKDVKAFQREAKRAKDSDVKAFAGNTLPTLQQHDQQAKQLYASVKGRATAKSGAAPSQPAASPSTSGSGSSKY